MIKITVGVEGMACGMCEAYINEAVSVSREPYEKKGLCSAFWGNADQSVKLQKYAQERRKIL